MATRKWRKPTEADKERKCLAKNPFEPEKFYVEWNPEFNCWALAGRQHILVMVSEVLEAKEK